MPITQWVCIVVHRFCCVNEVAVSEVVIFYLFIDENWLQYFWGTGVHTLQTSAMQIYTVHTFFNVYTSINTKEIEWIWWWSVLDIVDFFLWQQLNTLGAGSERTFVITHYSLLKNNIISYSVPHFLLFSNLKSNGICVLFSNKSHTNISSSFCQSFHLVHLENHYVVRKSK